MGFEGSFSDVLPYDHFETDNVQIYNAWHRKDGISQRTYFRSLIEDCRAQRSLFSNCKLTFTKRASNIAADKLASFFFFCSKNVLGRRISPPDCFCYLN